MAVLAILKEANTNNDGGSNNRQNKYTSDITFHIVTELWSKVVFD